MTSHINFIKKVATFSVNRLRSDVHQHVEVIHSPEYHSNKSTSAKYATTGLRAETITIGGVQKTYRRVFVLCHDSKKYAQVGWILTTDADGCMVCTTPLKSNNVKHHCRACGNVVCETCSTARALVKPIEDVGPVRVCSLCYFGQSPVESIANVRHGRPVIGEFSKDAEGSDEDDHEPISLWEFGMIEIVEIKPAFVIKTRRANRTVVYVNICSCPKVPHHPAVLEKNHNNDTVIYMVVGEMGVTLNDHSVYDIAVSPMMTIAASRNTEVLNNLCEQALIAVALHRHEKDFSYYTVDHHIANQYMRRKAKRNSTEFSASSPPDDHPLSPVLVETIMMAIPAPPAFQTLGQMATSLADALNPMPMSATQGAGGNSDKRREEIKEHAETQKLRLRAKLMCRTISQVKELSYKEGGGGGGGEGEESGRRPTSTPRSQGSGASNHHVGFADGIAERFSDSAATQGDDFRGNMRGGPPPNLRPLSMESSGSAVGGLTPRSSSGGNGGGSSGSWQTILLSPNPGFVIKSWRLDNPDAKAFINVFHHEMLDALLERDDFLLPDELQPFCAFGPQSFAEDHEGKPVPLFPVMIGSSYFNDAFLTSEKKITDDEYVQRIIENVNARYDHAGLDPMDSVILRVKGGFKGHWVENLNFSYRLPSRQYLRKKGQKRLTATTPSHSHSPHHHEGEVNARLTVMFAGGGGGSSRPSTPNGLPPTSPSSSSSSSFAVVSSGLHLPFSSGGGHSASSSRSPRISDTESVHSEITDISATSGGGSRSRRSSTIAEVFLAPFFSPEPNDFHLTAEMFQYRPQESIDWQDIVVLKHYSIERPDALVGWQITRTNSASYKGTVNEHFVVTGVRKNQITHKTEYRLSALGKPDLWCTLKRGEKKSGYPFRPNRKVLFLEGGAGGGGSGGEGRNGAVSEEK